MVVVIIVTFKLTQNFIHFFTFVKLQQKLNYFKKAAILYGGRAASKLAVNSQLKLVAPILA